MTDRLDGLRHIGRRDPEPLGPQEIRGSCNCGTRWRGGNVCHCGTCHQTFRSITGFDDHRDHQGDDRCRDATEIRDRGYVPDDNGLWRRAEARPTNTLPNRTADDG